MIEAKAKLAIDSALYSQLEGREISSNDPVIQGRIDEAKYALSQLPFPSRKDEKWKYTRVNKLVKSTFTEGQSDQHDQIQIPGLDAITLNLYNGKFDAAALSTLSELGITVHTLAQALEFESDCLRANWSKWVDYKNDVFTALNMLYTDFGLVMDVPKNTKIERPIHLVYWQDGGIAQYRNLVHVNAGAEIELVETFRNSSEEASYISRVMETVVEENAQLELTSFQEMNQDSFLLTEVGGVQHSNSRMTLNTFSVSGGWIRNDIGIDLAGLNIECNLNGAYMPVGSEHVDNHTVVDHQEPHCESNELYKGILSDKSTGVFNGKVYVREDAQKTNAYQQNANILMSDDAAMNSKPELEIYADDVKCSHGSTTGQFDQDALYYLKTRGISDAKAKKMLVKAFLSEVIENIGNEDLQEYAQQRMNRE